VAFIGDCAEPPVLEDALVALTLPADTRT